MCRCRLLYQDHGIQSKLAVSADGPSAYGRKATVRAQAIQGPPTMPAGRPEDEGRAILGVGGALTILMYSGPDAKSWWANAPRYYKGYCLQLEPKRAILLGSVV